jgi:2-amino-4-hydroxy-6-hydroxymethyldihydropteridine diphosphokinase
VAIALGSNLGDRHAHLRFAIDRLADTLANLRSSSFLETDPVDVPDPQPTYLNAAAIGETALDPEALLGALLEIERERGRVRPAPRAPRTLDLDLILFGNRRIDTPTLTVPHPRFRERAFVLQPLAEIAPDWTDPVTGCSIAELHRRLDRDART